MQPKEDAFQRTIATYNAIAGDYEQKSYRLDPGFDLPGFVELLPPNGTVLDAGCGYGRELRYFIDHGFDAYGVDASSGMLALARQRAPEAHISEGSVAKLEFGDDFFDGVWSRGVLHHLPRTEIVPALREFWRVLKPEGVVLVHLREGEGEVTIREDLSSGQERTFTQVTQEEIGAMMEQAGFSIVKNYHYNDHKRYGSGRMDANFVIAIGRKNK